MRPGAPAAMIGVTMLLLGAAVTQRDPRGNTVSPSGPAAPELVVTSPRDAGPGTLRDAILAADRLTGRAHIRLAVERVTVESALPALTNPHGVDIDVRPGSGTIDARQQSTGTTLQVNSPASSLRGLHIVNARGTGLIVNAPGVTLESVSIADSKVGLLLAAAVSGCSVQGSSFERNETALMAEPGVHDVTVSNSVFSGSSRAGFWLVGPAAKGESTARAKVRIVNSTFTQNASAVVLANQPVLVQKSHFTDNREAAVLLLGGAVRVEDSEIRTTKGTAISVTSGRSVELEHNTLSDNLSTAIIARDSEITIEHNALRNNAAGIVTILTSDGPTAVIRDNTITQSGGDALVVIGGTPLIERNQVLENHGVALRQLDLVTRTGRFKASARLVDNLFKGNAVDVPVAGEYKMTSGP